MAMIAALGAALLYAVAAALEHRAAEQAPANRAMRLALLTYLARRPMWLVGMAAGVGAYALQLTALDFGNLALVQPALASGLLFALPMGAALSRQHMPGRDWAGAILLVAGLAVFRLVIPQSETQAEPAITHWLAVGAGALSAVAVLFLAAGRLPGARRAMLLGAAAGVMNAFLAALGKSAVHVLDRGLLLLVFSWQPYALLVIGAFDLLLIQSSFQAGSLSASLPMVTAVDPVVSILIGAVLFEEQVLAPGGLAFVEFAALLAMIAGIFILGRSPLVLGARGEPLGPRPAASVAKR